MSHGSYWNDMFFYFRNSIWIIFNVVGLRLPKSIPFHNDRSYCPHCEMQLRWFELIPIVSYIIQQGKCRHCGKRIAKLYPLIEMIRGSLFAFAFWKIGLQVELIMILLLFSLAMILVVTDLNYLLIPNKILLFFLPLFIGLRILSLLDHWYDPLIGDPVEYILVML